VRERARQTIGCIVLIAIGIALVGGGIVTGASVDWQLVDSPVHFARRSSPAIVIVPMLILLGLAATVIGVVVLRLPVEDGRDG